MTNGTPPFHALPRSRRDHLVAAAQLQAGDGLPNGIDICDRVQDLRGGERPSNATTYDALDDLVGYGWLDRKHINDKTTGFKVTHEGRETLQRVVGLLEVDG